MEQLTRYVRFFEGGQEGGAPQFGILQGDAIAVVAGNFLHQQVAPTGRTVPLTNAHLLPPCEPTKIIGIGQNYRAHAAEMGKPVPEEPMLFMKPPSALLPTGRVIFAPRGYERVDFEGELAVVIGRRARLVQATSALDYVFGYTLCNDVTVRDLQKKDVQYTRAKGFDTFCPLGPCITTGITDPAQLRLRTLQNGVEKQNSLVSDLIFAVPQLIAFVSSVMTLEVGDVISTGTPSGVGPIVPGDTIAITIDEIGTLTNPVEAAL